MGSVFRILVLCIIVHKVNSQVGPYVLVVESAKVCKVTEMPAYTIPYAFELYEEAGKKLVRWNLTMPRRNRSVRTNVKVFSVKDNSLVMLFERDMVACEQILLKAFLAMSNFKIEHNGECSMNKGVFHGENIDSDHLTHVMSNVMPYGQYAVRFVWYVPRGVFVCQEIYFRVLPVKKT